MEVYISHAIGTAAIVELLCAMNSQIMLDYCWVVFMKNLELSEAAEMFASPSLAASVVLTDLKGRPLQASCAMRLALAGPKKPSVAWAFHFTDGRPPTWQYLLTCASGSVHREA